MEKKVRKVLTANGQTILKTFLVGEKPKSQENPTVKKPEQNLEPSTEPTIVPTKVDGVDKPTLTISMIRAMEPQELKVVAKELDLKLGNVKAKDKMQDKVIKLLNLEEEVIL